jgi:glycerol uptake facilitator-like aquaporin
VRRHFNANYYCCPDIDDCVADRQSFILESKIINFLAFADMKKQLIAEFIGTTLLLATVVGSGIMGDKLSGGNVAIALLANALATGAVLYVLINLFGPLSGAHFNPVVTLAMGYIGRMPRSYVLPYILIQVGAAICGVVLAHAMFGLPLLQWSQSPRTGWPQWISEAVATFGLVLTILGLLRHKAESIPQAVGLYIVAAYWFTASTSFANPAVTIARSLTHSFSGIDVHHVVAFIAAQCVGAFCAVAVGQHMFDAEK